MQKVKLAEALLRRKELQDKVSQLGQIKASDFVEVKMVRKAINENTDDIVAKVPKFTVAELTKEYDFYARRLRLVDAAIQQANWTTEIDVDSSVMADFEPVKA